MNKSKVISGTVTGKTNLGLTFTKELTVHIDFIDNNSYYIRVDIIDLNGELSIVETRSIEHRILKNMTRIDAEGTVEIPVIGTVVYPENDDSIDGDIVVEFQIMN